MAGDYPVALSRESSLSEQRVDLRIAAAELSEQLHRVGAAAALEFTFAACAIEEGWIPPSLGADELDPTIELNVPTAVTRGSFRRIISNSFAFGGNNVSLLVTAP